MKGIYKRWYVIVHKEIYVFNAFVHSYICIYIYTFLLFLYGQSEERQEAGVKEGGNVAEKSWSESSQCRDNCLCGQRA